MYHGKTRIPILQNYYFIEVFITFRLVVPAVGATGRTDHQQNDQPAVREQRLHLGALLHLHQPHQRRLRQRLRQHQRRENILHYRYAHWRSVSAVSLSLLLARLESY